MKNKRVKLLIAHDVLRGREEMARVSEEETFEFEELMPGKFTRYEVSPYLPLVRLISTWIKSGSKDREVELLGIVRTWKNGERTRRMGLELILKEGTGIEINERIGWSLINFNWWKNFNSAKKENWRVSFLESNYKKKKKKRKKINDY